MELKDWEPLEGVDDGIERIAFVDGVRRIDARLTIDDPVNGPVAGLCGTFAVGATLWDRPARRSEVVAVRIERWAVLAGGRTETLPPVDIEPGYRTTTTADRGPRPPHQGAAHQDASGRGRDAHRRWPPRASSSRTVRSTS